MNRSEPDEERCFLARLEKRHRGENHSISGAVEMERRRQAAVGEEDAREVGGPVIKDCGCQGNKGAIEGSLAGERHNTSPLCKQCSGCRIS